MKICFFINCFILVLMAVLCFFGIQAFPIGPNPYDIFVIGCDVASFVTWCSVLISCAVMVIVLKQKPWITRSKAICVCSSALVSLSIYCVNIMIDMENYPSPFSSPWQLITGQNRAIAACSSEKLLDLLLHNPRELYLALRSH